VKEKEEETVEEKEEEEQEVRFSVAYFDTRGYIQTNSLH